MNYYIVFFCNWTSRSNAIVRSVELTVVDPSSYVKQSNDYVYVDLTAHLKSTERKPFGNTIDAVMSELTKRIGGLSINGVPSTYTQISMSTVRIESSTPSSRQLTDWNDVVKPALLRVAHTSSFGTL